MTPTNKEAQVPMWSIKAKCSALAAFFGPVKAVSTRELIEFRQADHDGFEELAREVLAQEGGERYAL